jgi:hypothetical protein
MPAKSSGSASKKHLFNTRLKFIVKSQDTSPQRAASFSNYTSFHEILDKYCGKFNYIFS